MIKRQLQAGRVENRLQVCQLKKLIIIYNIQVQIVQLYSYLPITMWGKKPQFYFCNSFVWTHLLWQFCGKRSFN